MRRTLEDRTCGRLKKVQGGATGKKTKDGGVDRRFAICSVHRVRLYWTLLVRRAYHRPLYLKNLLETLARHSTPDAHEPCTSRTAWRRHVTAWY